MQGLVTVASPSKKAIKGLRVTVMFEQVLSFSGSPEKDLAFWRDIVLDDEGGGLNLQAGINACVPQLTCWSTADVDVISLLSFYFSIEIPADAPVTGTSPEAYVQGHVIATLLGTSTLLSRDVEHAEWLVLQANPSPDGELPPFERHLTIEQSELGLGSLHMYARVGPFPALLTEWASLTSALFVGSVSRSASPGLSLPVSSSSPHHLRSQSLPSTSTSSRRSSSIRLGPARRRPSSGRHATSWSPGRRRSDTALLISRVGPERQAACCSTQQR